MEAIHSIMFPHLYQNLHQSLGFGVLCLPRYKLEEKAMDLRRKLQIRSYLDQNQVIADSDLSPEIALYLCSSSPPHSNFSLHKHHHIDVEDEEGEGAEREEVHHYSTMSLSDNEDGDEDSRSKSGRW
uniref:Uncharacterized protein n=1 Tax=Davidia involucrata TaxID=16924 RepID=A0A5B7C2D1_DAVIN